MSPSSPIVHSSNPGIRTRFPVPPGPVFVPSRVQWYSVPSSLTTKSSMSTRMSGKVVMKDRADSVIAARPTEGVPPLMVSEPSGAYCAATLAGSWLHQRRWFPQRGTAHAPRRLVDSERGDVPRRAPPLRPSVGPVAAAGGAARLARARVLHGRARGCGLRRPRRSARRRAPRGARGRSGVGGRRPRHPRAPYVERDASPGRHDRSLDDPARRAARLTEARSLAVAGRGRLRLLAAVPAATLAAPLFES